MAKLLRNRWLRWTLVLAALIALGVGVYRFEEPAPMCVIEGGKLTPYVLTAEGRRLVTLPYHDFEPAQVKGPLEIWDLRTSEKLAHFPFGQGELLGAIAFSPDNCWFASEYSSRDGDDDFPPKTTLQIVHLPTGRSVEIPRRDSELQTSLHFSQKGDVIARIKSGEHTAKLSVFETATGFLVHEQQVVCLSNERAFVGDELLYTVRGANDQLTLVVWSLQQRQEMARLKGYVRTTDQTPDGGFWVAHEEPKGDLVTTGPFVVWNTTLHRPEIELQGANQVAFLATSSDGQYLALMSPLVDGSRIEVRELATERKVCSDHSHLIGALFSPDWRFLVVFREDSAEITMRMLETANMTELWDRPLPAELDGLNFGKDSRIVFYLSRKNLEIRGLDCNSREVRLRLALPVDPKDKFPTLKLTPDRGSMLVHQKQGAPSRPSWLERVPWLSRWTACNDTTVVLDAETCRERLSLRRSHVATAILSDDGQTLVTGHDEPGGRRVLRCWNVNAWKPLHWPIGVPAGLASLLVLCAWWRGRRRTPGQGLPPA